jgi:hypothetical protein
MTMKPFLPIICLLGAGLCHAQSSPGTTCLSVSLEGSLAQGQELDKVLGSGLVFRLWPFPLGKAVPDRGWVIDIDPYDRLAQDYISPVNFPLRESSSQALGLGYNPDTHKPNTAQQSLEHVHEMRFLLNSADFPWVSSVMAPMFKTERLPNQDVRPDYEQFLKVEASVPTGWLSFRVLSYEVDPATGFPRSIRFQAELSAPDTFKFADDLKPSPTGCRELSEKIAAAAKKSREALLGQTP